MPRRSSDDSLDEDDQYSPPPRSRSKRRALSPPSDSDDEEPSDETTEESDLERGRGGRGGGRGSGRGEREKDRYYGRGYRGGGSSRRSRGGRGPPPSDSDEEELLSTDPETTSEDDDRPPLRARPRKRRSTLPPAGADPPDAQDGSQRQLVLILGGVFCLCLLVLGGFAIYKYFKSKNGDSADSTSAGSTATVTVTASGQAPVATARVATSSAAKGSSSAGGSKTSSGASPSGSASSGSSSSGGDGLSGTFTGLSRNQIGIGFLPDGDKGQTMADITGGLGIKSSYYGWYAQLPEDGAEWDGKQLLNAMDDIKACECIFQPAVMPTKGWKGLTADDNAQALSIATIMKKFTDEGIEVWLRFAHEVNWYQSDGTYQGDADDFKAGWAAVAAAVADNDMVKMFFTPNIADLSTYQKFFPDDTSTVDIIGIDYYPKSSSESFVDKMQDFYSAYCTDGTIKFAIGETGTGWVATIDERLAWLAQGTAAETATAMPNYVGIAWFNYDKEEDFRLFITGDDSVNSATKAWIADGCSESGATIGNA